MGFEPTCRLPDNTLSRRARYDHFGTSPAGRTSYFTPFPTGPERPPWRSRPPAVLDESGAVRPDPIDDAPRLSQTGRVIRLGIREERVNETATAVTVFEALRGRLFGLAYRMLGSRADAEDIVQEAYVRWHQMANRTVENPEAFNTPFREFIKTLK